MAHFIFMPYGKRSEVELLLRDMEAQKHLIPMTKDNIKQGVHIQGQVRFLPFGVYEYVFPKEDMDLVLNTLILEQNRYNINNLILTFLRKMIKCEKIPDYKKEQKYLWIKDNVNIIPLGIRYDGEIVEPSGVYEGFTHEAI